MSETAKREMKRESLTTPTQSLHFQSRGMLDYPRIPISEWNLEKFPRSMEFQSWKINFRTEVCVRIADPQVTYALNQRS